MKANELRIGNLFIEKHCGETITVESISRERIGFSDEFYGKWQAEPIPITEEWLLKFGFKRGCPYSKEGGFTFPCDGFFFEKDVNLVLEESAGRIVTVVEYIHELQNLYFALTGEELKLNEK